MPKDLTFNDFEIKSIIKLCPNHNLIFEESNIGKPFDIIYTRIEVLNLYNKFCSIFNSYSLDRTLIWEKADIANLIDLINNSFEMPDLRTAGLCPEISAEELTELRGSL